MTRQVKKHITLSSWFPLFRTTCNVTRIFFFLLFIEGQTTCHHIGQHSWQRQPSRQVQNSGALWEYWFFAFSVGCVTHTQRWRRKMWYIYWGKNMKYELAKNVFLKQGLVKLILAILSWPAQSCFHYRYCGTNPLIKLLSLSFCVYTNIFFLRSGRCCFLRNFFSATYTCAGYKSILRLFDPGYRWGSKPPSVVVRNPCFLACGWVYHQAKCWHGDGATNILMDAQGRDYYIQQSVIHPCHYYTTLYQPL